MSVTELLAELPKLDRSQREEVWRRLEELELSDVEETPEMLAAIDAGRMSVREGKGCSVDEARNMVSQWTTKST